ncbi:MAG: hypothetical protein ABR907_01750 [Terracidiphilus sp.]
MKYINFLGIAAVFAVCTAVGAASAQSSYSPSLFSSSPVTPNEASSNPFHLDSGFNPDAAARSLSLALAPAGAGGGAGQSGGRHIASHGLAFELGAGFNAPIGNDTPYITFGGNFTGGAGLRFSKHLSLLGEFQFIDDKLPGAFVAAGGGQSGDAHIISVTADPVFELFPKRTYDAYLTGGGGYYHKSTNFNTQECCDFYGYPVNVTTNSFSSDQLGGNFGFGFSRRVGGVYGDGTMKLFAEARYLYIDTPSITQTNGLGKTELIPVTFGVRF